MKNKYIKVVNMNEKVIGIFIQSDLARQMNVSADTIIRHIKNGKVLKGFRLELEENYNRGLRK